MKAINSRNGEILADEVVVADTLTKRLKGLLGQTAMSAGEGLLIKPCISVHTIGMKFPIDVVFLDKRNIAIAIIRNMAPNRMSGLHPFSSCVIEFPAGTCDVKGMEKGDTIQIV